MRYIIKLADFLESIDSDTKVLIFEDDEDEQPLGVFRSYTQHITPRKENNDIILKYGSRRIKVFGSAPNEDYTIYVVLVTK